MPCTDVADNPADEGPQEESYRSEHDFNIEPSVSLGGH